LWKAGSEVSVSTVLAGEGQSRKNLSFQAGLPISWEDKTCHYHCEATRYGSVSKPIVPLVNIKIAGKWMFIPQKMVLIGIDPYPYYESYYIIS